MKTIRIRNCRICKSTNLKPVFSLGKLAISNFLRKPSPEAQKAPLQLVSCQKCSLLQLQHNAPQEIMWRRFYWYQSKLNKVIANDLKNIVRQGIKIAKLKKGDIVLDIGCNDCTLLKAVPKKYIRIGCEPALNFKRDLKKYTDKYINDFWFYEKYKSLKKAKLICAIGCFYDSPNPNQFVGDVKKALAEDGLFVSQMMTLHPMMKYNDIANICHEHLIYPNYQSLKTLFERNGLEIFKVEENSINGGSYRLFARHYKKGSIKYKEPKYGIRKYKKFFKRIDENRKKTYEFIKKVCSKGKVVYGYAASTKGNSLLQWYNLDNKMIKGIAEKNPEKVGKYTVKTNILIVPEKEARKKADYFFILSWGFTKEFIKREKKWYNDGGRFITSIPTFKVI